MKFTWETPEDESKEIVAYIDGDGDLVLPIKWEGLDAVVLRKNNEMLRCSWSPHAFGVQKVFWTGDKVTIEF